MKVILILGSTVIFLVVAGFAILLASAGNKNAHYYNYTDPQGAIETKYTPLGSYEVSYVEFDADNALCKKYDVWYPAEMNSEKITYPLVIIANGTGSRASQYKEFYSHLASWGFIVAGNEDENSRTGASSAATLDYMLMRNEDESSAFYGKIDTANIGIAGHSQGGVGAINAATAQPNGTMYRAIFTASATSRYHADVMNRTDGGWSIDPAKINVPIFMTAGTNLWDAGTITEYTAETLPEGEAQGICPLWWLNECYDAIPDPVDKVMARMADKDHGDLLKGPDAYMTAWFMYYLQGDAEAGRAFFGTNPEILENPHYQDQKSRQHR